MIRGRGHRYAVYVDSEKSGVFLSTEYSESFYMIENFSAICPSVYKYLPKQDILSFVV